MQVSSQPSFFAAFLTLLSNCFCKFGLIFSFLQTCSGHFFSNTFVNHLLISSQFFVQIASVPMLAALPLRSSSDEAWEKVAMQRVIKSKTFMVKLRCMLRVCK